MTCTRVGIPCDLLLILSLGGEYKAKDLRCPDGRGPQTCYRGDGRDPHRHAHGEADDLFGGPPGSPRTDKLIAASIQWAEKIMEKIDNVFADK